MTVIKEYLNAIDRNLDLSIRDYFLATGQWLYTFQLLQYPRRYWMHHRRASLPGVCSGKLINNVELLGLGGRVTLNVNKAICGSIKHVCRKG